MKPVIKVEKVRKIYPLYTEKIVALNGIDLVINQGEFLSIMGPSGAGKTTFLNLIGCLDKETDGSIEILGSKTSLLDEEALREMRLFHVGFVFQEFCLIEALTALENVQLPTIFARRDRDHERAKVLLQRVGLANRMDHLPKELSGGEMQRVGIARALVNRPDILLADEPTGNLDTKNAQAIYDLFKQLSIEEKITVVAATHNTKLAYQADRVIHLREGNVEKDIVVRRV